MAVSQSFIQSSLYRAGTHAATQLYLRVLQNCMFSYGGPKLARGAILTATNGLGDQLWLPKWPGGPFLAAGQCFRYSLGTFKH